MASEPTLIPVVLRPACEATSWHPAAPDLRVVPHYAEGVDPRLHLRQWGELPRLSCGQGYVANIPRHGIRDPLPTEWLAAPRWHGSLRVLDYHGGRSSSCYAVRVEVDDGRPPVEGLMSCPTFLELVPRLSGGACRGTWSARKQGQNYLIVPVSEDDPVQPADPSQPEPRIETGAVQFGDDWPGVFIRGDNAGYFAMMLDQYLRGQGGPLAAEILRGLLRTLEGCRLPRPEGQQDVLVLRSARECMRTY